MAWNPTYDPALKKDTVLLENGITFELIFKNEASGYQNFQKVKFGQAYNREGRPLRKTKTFRSEDKKIDIGSIFELLYSTILYTSTFQPSQKANYDSLDPGFKDPETTDPTKNDVTGPPPRLGSKGEEVLEVQKLLPGVFADGVFGPNTEFEVKRFQQFKNILANGIVNDETLRLLKEFETLNFITPPINPILNRETKQKQIAAINERNILIVEGSLSPQVVVQNTPTDLKPTGLQKLNNLITKIAIDSQKAIVLQLKQLLLQYGIQQLKEGLDNGENIEDLKQEYCPTPERLEELIEIRNNIAGLLNTVGDNLDNLVKATNFSGQFAELLQSLVSGLKGAEFVLNQAAKLIPLIPGAIAALINDLGTISDQVLLKPDGTPIIPTIRQVVSSVAPPFALTQQVIQMAVSLLDQLDELVLLCAPDATLTATSPTIDSIYATQVIAENTNTGNTYKGFILEIETRAYTPKVDQNRAVGKNNFGIVMIFTDYSFASDPNVLIDELKFIIDRDNLKAY
jgi:hypothetical protein|tara:strand:- start:13454 stop:14995 length:1542 start_codon:yes stop_codon:yes gene_type:complete